MCKEQYQTLIEQGNTPHLFEVKDYFLKKGRGLFKDTNSCTFEFTFELPQC